MSEILTELQSTKVALYRSDTAVLKFTGGDRLRYLHNQSTNDFNQLAPGDGCRTVFVTSTARTIELATAYATEDAVWVLVGANRRQHLLQWLDRFIFPMDRVEIVDLSESVRVFYLIGSNSRSILSGLGVEIGTQPFSHQLLSVGEVENVRVAVDSGLALPGYTFIVEAEAADALESTLSARATPIDDQTWEHLRILQGRPAADHELTEDYNPLEAGLWSTINFNKGCYIGQETIARLETYKGVKQRLWGVKLNRPVPAGTAIEVEDQRVGVLTSCTDCPDGAMGLGYVRTKAGGEGLTVQIESQTAQLVSVPFITHPSLTE